MQWLSSDTKEISNKKWCIRITGESFIKHRLPCSTSRDSDLSVLRWRDLWIYNSAKLQGNASAAGPGSPIEIPSNPQCLWLFKNHTVLMGQILCPSQPLTKNGSHCVPKPYDKVCFFVFFYSSSQSIEHPTAFKINFYSYWVFFLIPRVCQYIRDQVLWGFVVVLLEIHLYFW